MATDKPKTALLMAGAPVHGRILAEAMARGGCAADLIINEVGTSRAQRLSQFLGDAEDPPPALEVLTATTSTRLVEVDHFAGPRTLELMREYAIDFLILGGCGIVREPLLGSARRGVLNMHPGLLPAQRGLDPVLWAVALGQSVGATVHHVSPGIDEGDVLISRPMPWQGARTLLQTRLQVMRFGAQLLVQFLRAPDAYAPQSQDESQAQYFSAFPEERYADAEARLRAYVFDPMQGNRYCGMSGA